MGAILKDLLKGDIYKIHIIINLLEKERDQCRKNDPKRHFLQKLINELLEDSIGQKPYPSFKVKI